METGNKIFKIDSKGKTRVWFAEHDETKYRVVSGIDNGKLVESGWKYPEPKNVGKANETTVSEQVLSEVAALYTKQLNQGGYLTQEEFATGAITSDRTFFEPMLANKYDEKKAGFRILSQPKLDGGRAVASPHGLTSRQGKVIVSCSHINEALESFFRKNPNVILDGELYNHELKSDFERLMSLVRKSKPTDEDLSESKNIVEYHVYDCYFRNDKSVPFAQRAEFIERVFSDYDKSIHVVKTNSVSNKEELDALYAEYLADGYEGQMVRDASSSYENKRSKYLLKRKEFDDDEFEIVDILEGVGNWASYAKSAVIRLPNGDTQESGMRGNQEFLKEVFENKEDYIGTDVTVRYQGKTAYEKLRFPVVIKFWKEKRSM